MTQAMKLFIENTLRLLGWIVIRFEETKDGATITLKRR
jgi:hypothetical protein